jgi:hypothetical protein
VKKAYESVTGQEYNHYEYWIKIMSAVHHFSTLWGKDQEKILSAVIEWSSTDSVAYEDEEDVITHWMSFENKEGSVTYHTLFKFARLMRFEWPKEKLDKKGNPSGKPLVNEYANFKYLLDYYEISIFHEPYSNALYVICGRGDTGEILSHQSSHECSSERLAHSLKEKSTLQTLEVSPGQSL